MSRIVRTLAVSGAAAAAVVASASAASAAATPEAATAVVQSAATSAAGAPVTLPSGKTIRVSGLDSVSYRADAGHRTAVVTLADGPVEQGSGMAGNPPNTAPGGIGQGVGYNPGQVQTQAGVGTISATAVAALVLGITVVVLVKKSGLKVSWAVVCVAFGVLLSPTFIGPLVGTLAGTGANAFGTIWGGL
ncbi:hypothetical protein ACFCXP_37565 [Streptomyces niveus]|uniref:hypothetical protein n=1 Tax=Streptomyces niveus TaxID=193462 RepID=UPI0035DB0A19